MSLCPDHFDTHDLSSILGETVKLLPRVVHADGAWIKFYIAINKQNVLQLIEAINNRYFIFTN